ncbi:uncharacterized protein BDV17DRAFT_288968 [Aspergillus undulatus]|uniref:uncharacterized protein n=1 Tax=Aspergillus undulatus TaxID=1810928 RepID=UPI003CCDC7C4
MSFLPTEQVRCPSSANPPIDYVVHPAGDTIIILRDYNAPFAPIVTQRPAVHITSDYPSYQALAAAGHRQVAGAPGQVLIAAPVTPPPYSPEPVRFQVSSQHLLNASRVFANEVHNAIAMSGYGYVHFNNHPIEIPARGFDVAAYLTLLRIIHGEPGFFSVNTGPGIEEIAKLALLADFHGCRDAVSAWVNPRITRLSNDEMHYGRDLILFIYVAYVFQRPRIFNRMTRIAIMEAPGLIPSLGLPFPTEIMVALNDARISAIRGLINLVHHARREIFHAGEREVDDEAGTKSDGPKCSFQCRAFTLGCLELNMAQAGLLSGTEASHPPYEGMAYFELRRTIQNWKCSGTDKLTHTCKVHQQQAARGLGSNLPSSILHGYYADFTWTVQGLNLRKFVGNIPPRVGVTLMARALAKRG